MRILSLSAFFIFFITGCASTDQYQTRNSDSGFPQSAPEITDTQTFLSLLDEMNSNLKNGNPRTLSAVEQRNVDRLTSQLREQLAAVEHIEALSPAEQNRANEKAQELWSTIAGPQKDRPRCTPRHQVGSRLKKSVSC